MQTFASRFRGSFTVLAGLILFVGVAASASAQTVIASLPYTISASGAYVLNGNLSSAQTTGNLITVSASNVTLDFQNHYISGPVGDTGQSVFGISATESSNLTIMNGTIAYCYTGISVIGNGTPTTNSVDARIQNMRVTYCYGFGIDVESTPSSIITNCLVSQTGGTTYNNDPSVGINVIGAGITVQGNTVSNVTSTASVPGYCIFADTGCFLRQNQLSNATYGIDLGIYQDNLVSNCSIPFGVNDGGTDGGGNVHD